MSTSPACSLIGSAAAPFPPIAPKPAPLRGRTPHPNHSPAQGAQPSMIDSLKRTSLHWAAMAPPPNNVDCCALLFERGDAKSMLSKQTKVREGVGNEGTGGVA